ncbi:MAG: PDDEXK nuclease domain-containing protein [Zoogloeaceae bacterium]|jgi:predicted nuclease of restriction endonuclease-like (RecB) superfamily|nr:PDDEXK nuclease domain-containing protein [Zoogloeaceae bacterium]
MTKTDPGALLPTQGVLYAVVSSLIEEERRSLARQANGTTVFLFWRIGQLINTEVLNDRRAEYGERIVSALATQLTTRYGRSFEARNLRRMMQFAGQFPDFEIVSPLATQLNWSHIIEVLPLKTQEARIFYLKEAATAQLGKRALRQIIARKVFERKEIANAQLTDASAIPLDAFKDPYLLDMLGLKDGYLETDLETAILRELESFILEFGKGFAFVERQKRMIIDDEDFHLDLLFYHRGLKRLVAVELKLGKFKAKYKGQMELYLAWLNRYERQEGENAPIGLILCAEKSREQIELLQLDKDGIMVAEYWTAFPDKQVLEQKIHALLVSAREQMTRRKALSSNGK